MAWTISFMKDDCTCNAATLFSLKYLRTHRAGSVKYIRCFPHCCPEHSFTNFCTTSLGIRVSNVAHEALDDVAFLRFHTTTDALLQPGHEIAQRAVLDDVRSLANPKGDWIPSHMGQYNAQNKELSFRFNHNNSVGWHYGWMGTSTKAHRTCTHYLVAYILRPTSASVFRVLAVQPSPPFIAKPASGDSDACHCEGEFNVSEGLLPETPALRRSALNAPLPSSSLSLASAASGTVYTPRISLAECQLAILLFFVQEIPASVFLTEARVRNVITSRLFRPLLARFQATTAEHPPLMASRVARRPMSHVEPIQILCIEILSSVVDFFLDVNPRLFSTYVSVLFNRDQLYEAYALWLAEIHGVVVSHLGRHSETNLTQLVARIVQVSSQIDELRPVQTKLAQLHKMDAQASPGFDYFVAQLREVFLATAPTPPRPATSVFTRHWTYRQTVAHTYAPDVDDPALLSLVRAALIGFAFDACLDETTFTVQSALAVYETIPAVFELDGVGHVFRVLPHGESSLCQVAGLSHGDYVGDVDGDTIRLQLYSWPLGDDRTAHIVRVTLVADDEALDATIAVSRAALAQPMDISTSTAAARIDAFVAQETPVVSYHVVYTPRPDHSVS
ncbi:hypothetical protein SPRG_08952 [Saprolegnia parasitica CBS 223.65]|uniref:Uncharacterized protein n=1 Tax=Saprolegnia parasitica (strain CBS 223.65) TaxID=695850 RepID=A0A067C565_SAPPC|nr:hypothetical protein SPRG_08952 [Saprolegnia parasitica CBS 223.65]KDO25653.1 hypothetical protein SPRG_08952 [Saprolegnia parasitica CBS 223.65]|eukprot:XP_012203684.1 hypothetical protein SPRG_08952 [Saprolegnia parasitica CBS 223.65]